MEKYLKIIKSKFQLAKLKVDALTKKFQKLPKKNKVIVSAITFISIAGFICLILVLSGAFKPDKNRKFRDTKGLTKIEYFYPSIGSSDFKVKDGIIIKLDKDAKNLQSLEDKITLVNKDGDKVDFNITEKEDKLYIIEPESLDYETEYKLAFKDDYFKNPIETSFFTESKNDIATIYPTSIDEAGNSQIILQKSDSLYVVFKREIDNLNNFEFNKFYKLSDVSEKSGISLKQLEDNPDIVFLSNNSFKIHFNNYKNNKSGIIELNPDKFKAKELRYDGKTEIFFTLQNNSEADLSNQIKILLDSSDYIKIGDKTKIKLFIDPKIDLNSIIEKKNLQLFYDDFNNVNKTQLDFSLQKEVISLNTAKQQYGLDINIDEGDIGVLTLTPQKEWENSVDIKFTTNIKTKEGINLVGNQNYYINSINNFNISLNAKKAKDTNIYLINTTDISFNSNQDFDINAIKGKLSIYDENGNKVSFEEKEIDYGKSYISIQTKKLKIGKKYKAVIDKNIRSVLGETLKDDLEFELLIEQFEPFLNLYLPNTEYSNFLASQDVSFGLKARNYKNVKFSLLKAKDNSDLSAFNTTPVELIKSKNLSKFDSIKEQSFSTPENLINIETYKLINWGKLEKGAYLLAVTSSEGKFISSNYFIVSDNNLMVRISNNEIFAWLTDMNSGNAISNTEISCLLNQNSSIKMTTGVDGTARIPTNTTELKSFRCVVNDNSKYAFSSGNDPLSGKDYYGKNQDYKVVLLTDREIYDSTDEVNYKAIIRDKKGSLSFDTNAYKVKVFIEDNRALNRDGVQDPTFYTESELTEFGTSSGNIKFQNLTGNVRLVAKLIDKNSNKELLQESKSVYITKITKSAFQVNTKFDKQIYRQGENVRLDISAVNYNLAKEKFNIEVSFRGSSVYPDEELNKNIENSYYILDTQSSFSNKKLFTKNVTTDENGKAIIEFANNFDYLNPTSLIAEISIKNESGNQVWAYQQAQLLPKYLVWSSYESKTKERSYYFTDNQGNTIKNIPVSTKIQKVVSDIYLERVEDTYIRKIKTQKKLINQQNTLTNPNGAVVFSDKLFAESGSYEIEMIVEGKVFKNEVYIYNDDQNNTTSYSNKLDNTYYQALYSNRRLYFDVLEQDQKKEVGSDINIKISVPEENLTALITIEQNGKILEHQFVKFSQKENIFKLKLKEEYFPKAFVNFYLYKPSAETTDNLPLAYTSNVEVNVYKNKTSKVNLQLEKPSYSPKETVKINLNNDQNKKSEYTVMVVDKAVLDLLSREDKDFYYEFFDKGFYNEFATYENTRDLVNVINQRIYKLLEEKINQGKGGGGSGGEDINKDILRKKFDYVAYWNASVISDENGHATLSFELPDNLTVWNVFVLGVTKDTTIGTGSVDFQVNKDIFVNTNIPVLMYQNDEIELKANLSSSKEDVKGNLELICENCSFGDKNNLVLTDLSISKNSSNFQKVMMKASNEATNAKVKILFKVNDKVVDATENTIKLKSPVATQKIIQDGQSKKELKSPIKVPKEYINKNGEIEITIANGPIAYMPYTLSYLFEYEYKCTEQASSQIRSLIIDKKYGNISEEYQKSLIAEDLETIYSHQNFDGGWGLWQGSNSNLETSVYAYTTLLKLKNSGTEVNQKTLDFAKTYIQKQIENSNNESITSLFALAHLAETNEALQGFESYINSYYENEDLKVWEINYLARIYSYLYKNTNNKSYKDRSDELIKVLKDYSFKDQNGIFWIEKSSLVFLNGDLGLTSEILKTFVITDQDDKEINQIVNWIMKNMHQTTYNTLIIAESLDLYEQKKGEIKASSIKINDRDLELKKDNKYYKLYKLNISNFDQEELNLEINADSDFYYNITSKAQVPFSQTNSYFKNIIIDKEIYDKNTNLLKDQNLIDAQYYDVKLRILPIQNSTGLLIDDEILAGGYVIDSKLDIAKKDDYSSRYDRFYWSDEKSNFFLKDNKVLFYIPAISNTGKTFSYEVQVLNSGKYQVKPVHVESMYSNDAYGSRGKETSTFSVK